MPYLMIQSRSAQHVARGQRVACTSYFVRSVIGNGKTSFRPSSGNAEATVGTNEVFIYGDTCYSFVLYKCAKISDTLAAL